MPQVIKCLGIVGLCLSLLTLPSAASVRFDAAADFLSRTTAMPAFGNNTRMMWIYRVVDQGASDELTLLLATSASLTGYTAVAVDNASTFASIGALIGGVAGTVSGTSTTAIPLTTWMHLALVFDDTANTLTAYVNGILQYSKTGFAGTETWGYETIMNTAAAGVNMMNGRVMAYKQWTAALTMAEILTEMKYLVPARPQNIHSFTPFRNAGELSSYGGGATWTAAGTLTTEADVPVSVSPGAMFLSF